MISQCRICIVSIIVTLKFYYYFSKPLINISPWASLKICKLPLYFDSNLMLVEQEEILKCSLEHHVSFAFSDSSQVLIKYSEKHNDNLSLSPVVTTVSLKQSFSEHTISQFE